MRLLFAIPVLASLLAAQDQSLYLQSFDQVWRTVAEKHWNPKQLEQLPNGKSWTAVREEYRPKVATLQSETELVNLLRNMLSLLGKSHFAISGSERARSAKTRSGGPSSPGFRIDPVDGKLFVTHVAPDSPAARNGVKLGWEVVAVENTPLAPILSDLNASAPQTLQAELRRYQTLQEQLSGFGGQLVQYSFRLPDSTSKNVAIQLPGSDGSAGFGFMQGMDVPREFSRVGANRDIGYFRLGLFMDIIRVLPKLEEHVKACAACKGYIIDLRGNPGGIAVMANAISGWFVKDEGMKLGTMYQRDVELNFAVIPRLEAFTGPLAIIVDGASASTSEILAGGLQDAKRARIFGTRTAGAALPSVLEVLPTGDLFQFAIANYVSANGKELEGNGVTPDVIISHNRASLLKGQDAMLNAAANWIESPKPSARR